MMQNHTEGGQIDRITRSLRIGGFWILLEWFWQDFEKFSADLADAKETVVTSLVPNGVGKKNIPLVYTICFGKKDDFASKTLLKGCVFVKSRNVLYL